ncbi:partial Leukotoxin, partial [Anaerolineales bacterium]
MSNRIAFIDTQVENYQSLINGLPVGTEVVILNPAEDGLVQIAARLQGLTGLDAIDIFSHGEPGSITLGSAVLNNDSLANHAALLAEIGSHLSNAGDILLYGCDVAAGDIGHAFIQQLTQLTGADVAASTDLTGSAALGGDWVLEAQTGTVETASLQPTYDGVLGNYWGSSGDDVLTGSSSDDFMQGYSGSDTLNGGDGSDLIYDSKWWDNGIKDTNYLSGGTGQDYFGYSGFVGDSAFVTGGADSDTYYLDPNSTGLLVATDFEAGFGGDVLDIYSLLFTNPGYSWGDSIEGYLRIYQRGTGASTETLLQWDADGTAGSSGWRDVIKLENGGVALDPALLNYSNFSTWQLPPTSLHGSAPIVTNPPTQPLAAQFGQPFQFNIPADIFSDPDADPLSYSATLDGVTLTYDSATGQFSGAAPSLVGKYLIKITATDPSGNSATTPLTFLVPDPANVGTSSSDVKYGTPANDILVGLDGYDELYGYGGDDILVGDGTDSSLYYDNLVGGTGNDILYAGNAGAALYGNEDVDFLVGGSGNDWLDGGPGSDHTLGGAGDDYIYEADNSAGDVDTIDGGTGNDTIQYASYGGLAKVTGGAGADTFILNPYATGDLKITDFTVGTGGDTLDIAELVAFYVNNYGYTGNPFDPSNGYLRLNQVSPNATWLEWNDGTSWVRAAELQGVKVATLTVDNFTSLQPGDTLYAVPHAPVLDPLPEHHLAGVNFLYNYTLPAGTFTDADGDALLYSAQLVDGSGNLSALPSWLGFDSNTLTLSGTPTASDRTGTPLNIRISASDGSATISDDIQLLVVVAAGTSGNDNITGSVGNDNILGLGGSDNIYGFGGDDVLYGNGDGSTAGSWDYDYIYGGDGNDTIYGGDSAYWNNYLQGENGDDVIVGGNGADHIDGGAGGDTLFGGSGNDELSDQVWDDGINFINGGDGNDSIRYSGSTNGSATVTGGSGNDIYWLSSSTGTLAATDFQAGANGDILQIGEILSYAVIGYDGVTNPFASYYLRLFQDGADTLLQLNYNPAWNPPEYDWSWNTLIRLKNVSADALTQD